MAEFRRVLEKDPGFVRAYAFLGVSLSYLQRHDEAIEMGRVGAERSNQHAMLLLPLGLSLARAGQLAEARKTFDSIFSGLTPIYQAAALAMLGEESAAIDALEKAPAARSDWMYSVGRQPWFGGLHSNPRFVRLVESLGLPGPRRISPST